MWLKIKLYIISLWFLFFLIFANKVEIPSCFGPDCHFIGIIELLKINIIPAISLVFIISGIFFCLSFNYTIVKGAKDLPIKVKKVHDLNFETLSFLITYIIPLVCFDLDFNLEESRNLLMLFLVIILIGWIYIKANIFYTNPTLAVLGYRIYKIDTYHVNDIIAISRSLIKPGDSAQFKRIDENIYFIKKL